MLRKMMLKTLKLSMRRDEKKGWGLEEIGKHMQVILEWRNGPRRGGAEVQDGETTGEIGKHRLILSGDRYRTQTLKDFLTFDLPL